MKRALPHIFVFVAFITMVALGSWQLYRREWKTQMIQKIDSRISAPPLKIWNYKNIEEDEFKQIDIYGRFQYDNEVLILNKPFNGKQGQFVFTPLKTRTGEQILVNRGWTPSDAKISQPKGSVHIVGIIRATQKPNYIGRSITLQNKPEDGVWFWIDLPSLYESMDLPEKDFYIDRTGEIESNNYPYPLPKKIELYNEHLIYVFTWYGLSLALLGVYYFRFWCK